MSEKIIPIRVIMPDNEKSRNKRVSDIIRQIGAENNVGCADGHCNDCSCDKPVEGAVKYAPGKEDGDVFKSSFDDRKMLSCVSVLDADSMETNSDGHFELLFHIPENRLQPGFIEALKALDFDDIEIVHNYVDKTRLPFPKPIKKQNNHCLNRVKQASDTPSYENKTIQLHRTEQEPSFQRSR